MRGCGRVGMIVATLVMGASPAAHAATAEADSSASAYHILQRFGLLAPSSGAAATTTGGTTAPATGAKRAAPSAPEPDASTYGVLRRLGLLPANATAPASLVAPPPPEPEAAVTTPEPTLVAAAATTPSDVVSDAIEESAVSRAYALLRAKGLLPGGTPGGTQKASIRLYRPGAERVLVDKSERTLYLIKAGKTYKQYRISLGGVPFGPKVRRGDLRTPEGVYTLDWRNPRSRYYKSIHISYPNDQDRQRAEKLGVDPGGDIMLHGEHYLPALQRTIRRAKTPKDWTEGCIALNNEHIDEIWQEVADGTPIEIRP